MWRKMFYRHAAQSVMMLAFAVSVSFASSVHAQTEAENLINNPSFEQANASGGPSDWRSNSWGDIDASFDYPVSGINGGKAARVQVDSRQSGDAKWMFDRVAVEGGATYKFVDQYRSNQETMLVGEFEHENGSFSYEWFSTLPGQSDWTQAEAVIEIPEDVVAFTMFHLIAAPGWLTTDKYSLQKISGGDGNDNSGEQRGMVSITFDDGWVSQYDNAFPLLDAYGVDGTFYVYTDPLENWDGFMREHHLHSLAASGHEIGGHTVSHANLPQLSDEDAWDEITRSKQILEDMGLTIQTLAYPYGAYEPRIQNMLRDAGYSAGRTTWSGLNSPDTDPYALHSASPVSSTSLSEVTSQIDAAIANDEWFILTFHEIDRSGSTWSNTPEYLEEILKYIKEKNVQTVTVAEGMDILGQ